MDVAALSALMETDRAAAGSALDAALQSKHGQGNERAMLALHGLAASYWRDDPQQVAFHRTHAYVYALELGDWPEVERLYALLSADGRI